MTAVQWLIQQMTKEKGLTESYDIFQQALIMEKEQIKQAQQVSAVSGSLPLPIDAHSIEVFAIKDSENSPTGKEAFIGYKLKTGCFHFISVPYSGNDL